MAKEAKTTTKRTAGKRSSAPKATSKKVKARPIEKKRKRGRRTGAGRNAADGNAVADSATIDSAAAKISSGDMPWLTVVGSRHNNLQDIDVSVPLERFVCVTGVSGSGKSSLVNGIIREVLNRDLNGALKCKPGDHDRIVGLQHLDKIIDIDQSPIGRTPRSNPATYIKVFDEIRTLFAKLPDSIVRGYKPGRYSFNVKTGKQGGGRCESCEGNGSYRMEMELLADIWITCPVCSGRRFSRETLQIAYKGKNIADVLEMDVQEALAHFENVPRIKGMLQTLHDVGLDYVKLGQSSTTLSGGEAQRIKLARELVKRSTGRTLYVLDEPTTGLHFEDIKKLLSVLHGFVDAGNSVLVIEHNLDVVKTADWIIDLGPEGGAAGGRLIAEGTPERIASVRRSETGQALQGVLEASRRGGGLSQREIAGARKATSAKVRKRAEKSAIEVRGARQHNLKDVDVAIPRGKMTVCSGPSGSGKTSMAIDTVYAEGQRRYIESLSAYARQFLGRFQPPKVDQVQGLSPSICIEQRNTAKSPRSTVGTITEIYDYMRVLWARIGQAYCPACAVPVGAQEVDEIVSRVLELPVGSKLLIMAPVAPIGQESMKAMLVRYRESGYRRVMVDGDMHDLDDPPKLGRTHDHDVSLVVDRAVVKSSRQGRLADSVEQALSLGQGVVELEVVGREDGDSTQRLRFSQHRSCPECHESYAALTPHHFSFNSRLGWCPVCEGLGVQQGASASTIVVHPTKGLIDGAIAGWGDITPGSKLHALVEAVCGHIGFDPSTPWNELGESQQLAVLHGCGEDWIAVDEHVLSGVRVQWRGFFPGIDRAAKANWQFRKSLRGMASTIDCQSCKGSRLCDESAAVRVNDHTIREVCAMPLAVARDWFKGLRLSATDRRIAGELLHEIRSRLDFLCEVGLDYVSLNRPAATLSGGESQRIQLASQIGTGLTGVLYVLDEPTVGLHPRDNRRLIQALHRLRGLGNTLLLVEHDREVIDAADHVLDFGPQAGAFGGEITATGSPRGIQRKKASLTGRYLSGKVSIPVPTNRRPVRVASDPESSDQPWLTVHGARENNLKEIDVSFPLGRFTCVTGVSGSGKSTLVSDIMHKALAARIHRASLVPGGHERISGVERIDKVINIDQSPIGNSPTSNPATYTGVFDLIRELFAKLPTAKIRGYTANRFSFNRPGGRCEACQGMGMTCVEMHFLPDVWVSCESCQGRRYVTETLDVTYHDKSIADVLEMRVSEALELFDKVPKIRRMMRTLDDVGLGYVQLGQAATTLSGGEAQRVKLAAELGRPSTGKTLYLLDEPTTGLHFDDLGKLLRVLHRLVDLGNTCICVEHNLDVIKTADWLIDLGPEAGAEGGEIVIEGPPEVVAKTSGSHTGKALKPVLEAGPHAVRPVQEIEQLVEQEAVKAEPLDVDPGEDIRMPWEEDGKRWHTVDHVDPQGDLVRWDTNVLIWLVETVENLASFEPTLWNHRTLVEITAKKNKQWFAHFLTGGSDLLDVALRVPEGCLDQSDIEKLGIRTLDEREDLPIYGQWSRARLRPVGNGWMAVRLAVRDFDDIDKRAVRAFLSKAAKGYMQELDDQQKTPGKGKPWKADGRSWHLGQKAMRHRARATWKPDLILSLLAKINAFERDLKVDWNQESAVLIMVPGEAKRFAKIVTNQAKGVRIEIKSQQGAITPAMMDRLGTHGEIRTRPDGDWVLFWLRTMDDVDFKQCQDVWTRCRAAADEERLKSA